MRGIEILIVDDSAADLASLRIAFERQEFPLRLHFAVNGRTALDMLTPVDERPPLRPHLMLVDIKMPGMSGFDVLAAVKQQPATTHIPIFMLSGSDDQRDVRRAYVGSASGFIRKPLEIVDLEEIADVLGRLATRVLIFPERSA